MNMSNRLYSIRYLRKFHESVFILHRLEDEEYFYTYEEVLQEVTLLQLQFDYLKLPQFSGVGLRIQDHSPALIVLLISLLNNGCFFCPLEYKDLNADISLTLLSHKANYLIVDCNTTLYKDLNPLGILRIFRKHFQIYQANNNLLQNSRLLRGQEICYSIATSGSTGVPKVVQVPYECIRTNISSLSRSLQVSTSDVVFLGTSFTFDPFVVEFFLGMQNGATLLITEERIRLVPQKSLQCLFPSIAQQSKVNKNNYSNVGVTILQMTPSIFRLFGKAEIQNIFCNKNTSLRTLILGGEEFPTAKEWRTWLPWIPKKISVYNLYGITELSCWSTFHVFDLESHWYNIPLGKPLDDETQLRLINSDGVVLEGATEGHLQIGSLTRRCYIPSLDSDSWHRNEFIFRNTGDWVQRDFNGNIFYLGRINNVIKRLGKRLCLETLQRKILTILAGRCKQAICVWDQMKQKLCCVLLADVCDGATFDLQFCRRLLIKNLRNEEKLDSIIYVKQLCLNAHGKINRFELLSHLRRLMRTKSNQPIDILHNFLRETLGFNMTTTTSRDRKHLLPSFFSLGGTSFQAISLSTEISNLVVNPSILQSKLLEMLFDSQQSLSNVVVLLSTCTIDNCNPDEGTKSLIKCAKNDIHFYLQWRVNFGKCVDSAPVIVNNHWICVGAHSHELLTLDIEHGNVIARLELPDRIECKVEFSTYKQTEMAFVGCYDGHLYTFDVMNGKVKWSVNVGGLIKAKPLFCHTGIIVASYAETHNLLYVCIKSQKIQWRRKIGTKGIYASPVMFDSSSFLICTLDGTYSRIDSSSGQTVWECKTSSPIFSTPALIIGGLYFIVAEVVGKVHICTASNGSILETFVAGGNIFSSVIVTSTILDILILFGCYDEKVYCLRCTNSDELNSHSLELLWTASMGARVFATPTVLTLKDKNYVLGCSTKGLLMLILLADGEVVNMHKLHTEIFSTPCAFGDRIYFGSRDNHVYSFKIK